MRDATTKSMPGRIVEEESAEGHQMRVDYAAIIEWMNERVARPEDYSARDPRFERIKPQ
jgi:hypothetical protein